MLILILRRLNLFIVTMLVLTVIAFSLNFLFPGDPIINMSGHVNSSITHIEQLKLTYNADGNIASQYWAYLQQLLQGNFGISQSSQNPIQNEILQFLPATIELSIVALFIAMILGIPLGFIAAIWHRKVADTVILSIAMIGYSIPVFWLGLLAILIFSINLAWLPSAGQMNLLFEIKRVTGIGFIDILLSDSPYKWQAFKDATLHIILPSVVVAMAPMTVFIRLARGAMLEVLETSYIKAAKAKGLSFAEIIYHHGIRNALVNIIRHVGLQFANLITLAMITEVIFDWPGIGRWLIESIYQRDYTAIQAGLLVMSAFIFIVHIIIDIVYAAINPIAREQK